MTKRYTGGVVSSSLPTVNAAGASGVFLLSQQSDYQSRNAWPPYKVEESLRFRRSASGYLNRTPASASNQKTWTWSGWVKRGSLGSFQRFFTARNDINDESAGLRFDSSDRFDFIFSYWIFIWYILYELKIVSYNPKGALVFALVENLILFQIIL